MKKHKSRYLKIYGLTILGISGVFGIVNYILDGAVELFDIYFLMDIIIAVTIAIGIDYMGKKPVDINEMNMLESFCMFEATHDKEKVDVIYTYIVTIPTFIYLLVAYSFRQVIPRPFKSISMLIIILYSFSFIGYKLCYLNKDDKSFIKADR